MLIFPRVLPHLLAIVFIVDLSSWQAAIIKFFPLLWPLLILLDLVEKPCLKRRSGHPEKTWKLILWAWVPLHILMILNCLALVSSDSTSIGDTIIIAGFAGFFLGMIGISVAHELLHHRCRTERYLSEILMSLFSYPHFCIEHIEGHHKNVGTVLDPVSAHKNRSFYFHYPRAIAGSFFDAWDIENRRLSDRKLSFFNIGNRMLRYGFVLFSMYVLTYIVFGISGVIFLALQSVVGFSLLELINYIQHYGLARKKDGSGRYERVNFLHSWDSNHLATNCMLFNLGYHSEHHCNPSLGYEKLKHTRTSPQLPVGYFAAIWVCLIPPLWRHVMNERAKSFDRVCSEMKRHDVISA